MGSYRLINHTADIGIEIKAKNEQELFFEGIRALFFLLTDREIERFQYDKNDLIKKRVKIRFELFDELFIDFINRILYIVDTFNILPVDLNMKMKRGVLQASVFFVEHSWVSIKREIKAATFHNFKIEKDKESLKTRIIFDI